MRRLGVIALVVLAGLVGAAVAAIAARDAVYWERALPGVELRTVDLAQRLAVTVGGETYEVRPGEALLVDRAATQLALVRAGHDSFSQRIRRLADPSPPKLLVDPVLAPRPGLEEL